jgi:amino acid permease
MSENAAPAQGAPKESVTWAIALAALLLIAGGVVFFWADVQIGMWLTVAAIVVGVLQIAVDVHKLD